MKNLTKLFIIAVLVLSFGCTQRLLDFTVVSSKNVDMSKSNTFERGKSRVEGKDIAYIILFIPTGVPNMKEAIDKALEKVPGAVALVDGVVSSKVVYFLLGGMTGYVVEGTPLIDPSLASNELKSNFMICKADKNGEVSSLEYVTEKEYNKIKNKYLN